MKTLVTLTAASAIALFASGASTPVAAGDGGAIAGAALGGLAVGAIIGSQAARPRSYYGGPAYVEDVYVAQPQPVNRECYYQRREYMDQWGNVRVRNVRVC